MITTEANTKGFILMDKCAMPLIAALEKQISENNIRMHMPGHKGGKGFPQWFSERSMLYDYTELPGLDNLHHPEGILRESMEACAKAFGAKRSFFLVNGSTSGIHGLLLSALNRGDKLLVSANCHVSVIHGLILFGIEPVFVMPEVHRNWQISVPVNLEAWERALSVNADVKGAIVTSPDYFGCCAPLEQLSAMLHHKDKFLLVDEAHGAHFAFSHKLPPTALQQGADMCVQSLHKTMYALTQSALLHYGDSIIAEERVAKAVSMLTTTSPSYLLMASIDYCRSLFEEEGEELYSELLNHLDSVKWDLSQMKKFRLVPDSITGIYRDPTRIVIDTGMSEISGYQLMEQLQVSYGISAEMADEFHVVFIVTPADSKQELHHLTNSLMDLDQKVGIRQSAVDVNESIVTGNRKIVDLSRFLGKHSVKPLEEAEGCICASIVTPYPPGVPVLLPGEIITRDHIELLNRRVNNGCDVHGLEKSRVGNGILIQVFV